MGQGVALGVFGVLQQASSRANGNRQVIATKAAEVTSAKLLVKQSMGAVDFKFPGCATAQAGPFIKKFYVN